MISKKEPQSGPVKERIARFLRVADYMVKEGKYEEAVIQIEKALQLDPKNYYARSFLERIRAHMDKLQQKATEDGKSKQLNEEQKLEQISLLLRAADQFIAAKNFKLALQQVAKVYAIDPQNYYTQAYPTALISLLRRTNGPSRSQFLPNRWSTRLWKHSTRNLNGRLASVQAWQCTANC